MSSNMLGQWDLGGYNWPDMQMERQWVHLIHFKPEGR